MLISYPIMTPEAGAGGNVRNTAYSARMFADPPIGSGAYPFSANMRWHGGVHLSYGSEPIRCVADGKVVFVRSATAKNSNAQDPLNYGSIDGSTVSWTDNGCVVIEHETETGEKTKFVFWSVYMHLSSISVKDGQAIERKAPIGRGGEIAGVPAVHFEIFTNQAGIDALVKRGNQPYRVFDSSTQAGDPDLWGDTHFVVPAGTAIYDRTPEAARAAHDAWKKEKAKHDHAEHARVSEVLRQARARHQRPDPGLAKAQPYAVAEPSLTCSKIASTDRQLNITVIFAKGKCSTATYGDDGNMIGTAEHPDPHYEYKMNQIARSIDPAAVSAAYELVRWGRVVGPDSLQAETAENWKYIAYDHDHKGYIDLNEKGIVKLSDADFPAFLGWRIVREGEKGTSKTPDGRCDPRTILGLLGEPIDASMTDQQAASRLRENPVRKKLRRLICEFRTEWEAANFDFTYGFLMKDGTWGDGSPRTAMTSDQYAQFKGHVNALQWWADARLSLSPTLWHFHPIEFIDWMSACRWLDKSTLSRIYAKTPEGVRETYRAALNKVMQKYVFIDAIRQAHFLGQGAVESSSLQNMQEASMLNNRLNPASTESEAELGHWYGKEPSEFDDYYSSEKFNSKGKRITGSYSWVNGNVGDVDAQEFRGRGFKQLTGRENYAAYWIYRGWLKTTEFDDSWWLDHEYKRHNPEKMKQRPAKIDEPDRIIRNPYNCIDSGGFFVAIKNNGVKPEIDASRGIVPETDQEKEDEKKISAAVTHVINGGYIEKDRRYLSTIDALKVLN